MFASPGAVGARVSASENNGRTRAFVYTSSVRRAEESSPSIAVRSFYSPHERDVSGRETGACASSLIVRRPVDSGILRAPEDARRRRETTAKRTRDEAIFSHPGEFEIADEDRARISSRVAFSDVSPPPVSFPHYYVCCRGRESSNRKFGFASGERSSGN